jgi:hypothetical protein
VAEGKSASEQNCRIPFDFARAVSTIFQSASQNPLPHHPMSSPCKHPRVRVVSRQEDAEFVECELCGEVFDSEEFRDMMIEEKQLAGADEEDQQGKS